MKLKKNIKSIDWIHVDEFKEHIKSITKVSFDEYRGRPNINDTFLWLIACRYFTAKLGSEPGMLAADNVCEILNIDCEQRRVNNKIRRLKMGATDFVISIKKDSMTPQEAFAKLRKEAVERYGNRGYTGTIAEKVNFVKVEIKDESMEGVMSIVRSATDEYVEGGISDKFGPAGMIETETEYIFFGVAGC